MKKDSPPSRFAKTAAAQLQSCIYQDELTLLEKFQAFLAFPHGSRLGDVVQWFLAVNGRRLITPLSERIEFLKSTHLELVRFALLEHIVRLNNDLLRSIFDDRGKKEMVVLFISAAVSPWCTYSSIFGVSCSECPQFVLSESTQKLSLVNDHIACWTPDGYWRPMVNVLGNPDINFDLFRKVSSVYLNVGLPMAFLKEATGE